MLGYNGNACGLDVENSKFPAGLPWHTGFYLSVVSITSTHTKRSWLLTHDENVHNKAYLIYDQAIQEIQEELDKFEVICGHNLKHDLNVLKYYGLDVSKHKLHCTMVAEYMINGHEQAIDLNTLATRYGQEVKDDRIKKMWQGGMDTAQIPTSILIPYCEHDCDVPRRVAKKQYQTMLKSGMLKLFNIQMEFMDCLSDMEITGFKWDNNYADEIIKRYSKYRDILERKLKALFGRDDINLSSNDDLSACLYGGFLKRTRLGPVIRRKNIRTQMPYLFTYKDGKTAIKLRWKDHRDTPIIRYINREYYDEIKGLGINPLPKSHTAKSTPEYPYYQTNKEILPLLKCVNKSQRLAVAILLRLSAISKVISTFKGETSSTGLVSKVDRRGFIHTTFNQAITTTGRLSSSNPNGQNLPRGNTSPIKKCIVPRFDGIMNADLSQIEWRVPAQLSGDIRMIYEINHGIDQHIQACTKLMKLPFISKSDKASKKNRDSAKVFNFRMIYGGTEYGFHKDPKMPRFGLRGWRKVVNGFYNRYPGLKNWQDNNVNKVIANHGRLQSDTGRLYVFPLTGNGKYDERKIKNYPVQGMAGGDILPLATVIIRRYMRKYRLRSVMMLTVHDSIVFDYVKDEEKRLADICMHVFRNLPVYIRYAYGIEWNVDLTGEVEVGPTYGNLKQIAG
jgi:DNA polymerase I-like protein with 3'-5' exonuclease and polymerase domains